MEKEITLKPGDIAVVVLGDKETGTVALIPYNEMERLFEYWRGGLVEPDLPKVRGTMTPKEKLAELSIADLKELRSMAMVTYKSGMDEKTKEYWSGILVETDMELHRRITDIFGPIQ